MPSGGSWSICQSSLGLMYLNHYIHTWLLLCAQSILMSLQLSSKSSTSSTSLIQTQIMYSNNKCNPHSIKTLSIYLCMHACMYLCNYISMHVCMHACICACICACMFVFIHPSIRVWSQTGRGRREAAGEQPGSAQSWRGKPGRDVAQLAGTLWPGRPTLSAAAEWEAPEHRSTGFRFFSHRYTAWEASGDAPEESRLPGDEFGLRVGVRRSRLVAKSSSGRISPGCYGGSDSSW